MQEQRTCRRLELHIDLGVPGEALALGYHREVEAVGEWCGGIGEDTEGDLFVGADAGRRENQEKRCKAAMDHLGQPV
jgi:hypothetical protein